MRKFGADELVRFLEAVDKHLSKPEKLIIIGGSALALGYDATYRTYDIDTWNTLSPALMRACKKAAEDTGLPVHVSRAGVADAPYDSEDRLVPVLTKLRRLTVLVFDEYDVALSKVVRGEKKDLDAIRALHRRHPLDQETLVSLYINEMGHVVGNKDAIDQNFINLVDHLYGPSEAEEVAARLSGRRP